jgi:hypothetical protein
MKNFVNGFGTWCQLNEAEDFDQEIEDLKQLVSVGMIEPIEIRKVLSKRKVSDIIANDPNIQEIVNSPEYKRFQELGLELVGSHIQLLNGNIIIGYPGYSSKDQFALGFFKDGRVIKRMTPKGIPMGVWGRHIGSMDFRIKEFTNISKDSFYRVAMRWALDHIDFDMLDGTTETPYFPAKKRTSSRYFDQD